MKKISYLFACIALCISATVFVSCSDDTDVAPETESAVDVNSFLRSYYGEDFRFGKSVNVPVMLNSEVSRSASTTNYVVTEIFVGTETVASGYDVTDRATKAPLFLLDIDRDHYVAKTVEYRTSQTYLANDINLSPDYDSSHHFDLIWVITDPGYTEPPHYQVNGWEYTYGAPYYYNGKCYKAVYRQFKVLGISFTKVEPVMNENGTPLAIGCDESYNGKK